MVKAINLTQRNNNYVQLMYNCNSFDAFKAKLYSGTNLLVQYASRK